jgi:hypothetical protein
MKKFHSYVLLGSDIDGGEIEKVCVGIVAVDFKDFGNESSPGPALDLNDNVQRIADVGLDGAVRELDAALQNTTREASETLLGGTRVNGRKRTGVARIEKLQEVEGLPAPDFAELRGGYACGWCELKKDILTVLPHPNSGAESRHFHYPQEAEIVGRVTGVAMRIASGAPRERRARKKRGR